MPRRKRTLNARIGEPRVTSQWSIKLLGWGPKTVFTDKKPGSVSRSKKKRVKKEKRRSFVSIAPELKNG